MQYHISLCNSECTMADTSHQDIELLGPSKIKLIYDDSPSYSKGV